VSQNLQCKSKLGIASCGLTITACRMITAEHPWKLRNALSKVTNADLL